MIKVWNPSIVHGLVNEMYLMISTDDRSPCCFPAGRCEKLAGENKVDREAPDRYVIQVAERTMWCLRPSFKLV